MIAFDITLFLYMLLAGFLAELVAGSMGMGYGVMCTTLLLLFNIPPATISASIHFAETFTTAAGSLSHWRLKNIRWEWVKQLAIPAVLGAIIGALALSYFGEEYAQYTKPVIALYLMYLGLKILLQTLPRHTVKRAKTFKHIPVLGFIGGFIDSFIGGGWGPLVTGTLIKNGKEPRYVVGSSTMAKFTLTVASAITFLFTIGIQEISIILGLLVGGVIGAPIAAQITHRVPSRIMFFIVGTLIILMSGITFFKAFLL